MPETTLQHQMGLWLSETSLSSAIVREIPGEEGLEEWLRAWCKWGHRYDRVQLYQVALDAFEQEQPSKRLLAQQLHRLARFMEWNAHFDNAHQYYQRAYDLRKTCLGEEHDDTLETLRRWLRMQMDRHQTKEAEVRCRQTLASLEKSRGVQSPYTVCFLGLLGRIHYNKGDYAQANITLEHTLSLGERVFSSTAPVMAEMVNDLATVLEAKGQFTQAEKHYRRALSMYQSSLSPTHPKVAELFNNLGLVLARQQKMEQAEELFDKALKINETVLGPNNLHVGVNLHNLGWLRHHQYRWDEAEALYYRVLPIYTTAWGKGHKNLFKLFECLSMLMTQRGDVDAAIKQSEQTLQLAEECLGAEHPELAPIYNNHAIRMEAQQEWNKAEALYRRSVTIYDRLGIESPELAQTLWNGVSVLKKQGHHDESLAWAQRARALNKRFLKPMADMLQALTPESSDVPTKDQGSDVMALDLKRLRRMLRSPRPSTRAQASQAYQAMGIHALPELRRALRENNQTVQLEVIGILGTLGADAVSVLMELFPAEREELDTAILQALGHMGEGAKDAVPLLIDMLHEEDSSICMKVIECLGQIGPSANAAVSSLSELLNTDDWHIREHATKALSQIRSPESPSQVDLTALHETAREEAPTQTRNAFHVICEMEEKPVPKPDLSVIALLLKELDSPHEQEVCLAMSILQRLDSLPEEAVPALSQVMQRQVSHIGQSAAYLLRKQGQKAIPALLDGLRHDNHEVKRYAYLGLNASPLSQVASLVEVLYDFDPGTRLWAMLALEDICRRGFHRQESDPTEALALLQELLQHKDPQLRHRAARILGSWGEEARCTIPALQRALHGSDTALSQQAAISLAAMGEYSTDMLQVLQQLAQTGEDYYKNQAIQALGWLGEQAVEAIPTLLKVLAESPERLPYIFQALGESGGAARPTLEKLLQHEEPAVRHYAAYLLDENNATNLVTIDVWREALESQDLRIQRYAAIQLRRRGEESTSYPHERMSL